MEASHLEANPNPNTNNNVNRNSIMSSTPLWPTIDGPLGLTEEESLSSSRKFYKFGYALLPWLWAVNCFYFWPALHHPGSFPRIRRYVVGSVIGFTVFTALLCSWALTFAIGGEDLFGPVWEKLLMYNLAERLGLTALAMYFFPQPVFLQLVNMRISQESHWFLVCSNISTSQTRIDWDNYLMNQ